MKESFIALFAIYDEKNVLTVNSKSSAKRSRAQMGQ